MKLLFVWLKIISFTVKNITFNCFGKLYKILFPIIQSFNFIKEPIINAAPYSSPSSLQESENVVNS